MKIIETHSRLYHLSALCLLASAVLVSGTALAQVAVRARAARISAEISTSQVSMIPGSLHPLAQAKFESGRLQASTKLEGISLYFNRSAAQEAELKALLVSQQDINSPNYHKWLNPDQFGRRFGMADSDIAKTQSWLEQQGFSIDSVARGKNVIRFSGTVSQVETAFATEMHHYTYSGEKHFAPSSALSLPSALAAVVLDIRNLDDFRPKPMMKPSKLGGVKPGFTSGINGTHFLTPGDITTIYDVNALHQAGYTGTGQTIAILGQSEIVMPDIEAFQNAAGLAVKDPLRVLVPSSGTATIYSGDEGESDLDLEWVGAMAPDATILFVYTGDATNSGGVFDSAQYAVDNRLASIISISYGTCEFDISSAGATSVETIAQQAAAQGQTIFAASGDAGATSCHGSKSDTVANQEQLNVSYPASSPYVTGVGGTEFREGDDTSGTYWNNNGTGDVVSSAKSYIPEMVWNDGADKYISATGGGVSTLFAKPTWQTGVTGIPSDGKRDVPDISLDSSNNHDPYLLCSSDTTDWVAAGQGQVAQQSSCTSGFRDTTTNYLTAAGGTSFATPIVAGMLALINQKENSTGQGLINPALYALASNATKYASAFNDITVGNNDCVGGSSVCSSTAGYSAGIGYDLVTGLGTIDLYNLANVWPVGTEAALFGTTTTATTSNTAPLVNSSVTFTITVASITNSTVPTGPVSISVDGTAVTATQPLINGTANYQTIFSTVGTHTAVFNYGGDATHAPSSGTALVSVGGTSFKIAANDITVSDGSVGSSTVTVTPAGGYKGTIVFNLTTSSSAIGSACFTVSNAIVTGTAAATTTLNIDTNASRCVNTGAARSSTHRLVQKSGAPSHQSKGTGSKPIAAAALFAGLLFAGAMGRYSRKLRSLAGVVLLVAMGTAGMAFVGCGGGGGSGSTTPSNPPKGTYAMTLTGQDSTTATITSSTSLTLTIQ